MHKIVGAHLQCVKKRYAKLTYRGIYNLELQLTQNRHRQSISEEKMSNLNTPSKMRKYVSNVQIIGGVPCLQTLLIVHTWKMWVFTFGTINLKILFCPKYLDG